MKIKIVGLLSVLLSNGALATQICDYTSGNNSSLIVDLQLCSQEFGCDIRNTTVFDRDGVTLDTKWGWSNSGTSFIKPTNGGNFTTQFDSSSWTGAFANTAVSGNWSKSFGGGGFGAGVLSAGNHTVSAKVQYQNGPSCAESASFRVEKTKIFGELQSAVKGGEVKGIACVKGMETNRKKSVEVTFWAGPGDSSNIKLGSATSNQSGSSADCGNPSGFVKQLTERQQQDYCDQPLWATVKDATGYVDTVLVGSQNYLVPCALRPYVASVTANKNGQVIASGSNFKNGTKVEVFDVNNTSWGVLPVVFNSSKSISFTLPDISPPSRCNKFSTCTVKVVFTNPDGATTGVNTQSTVVLQNLSNTFIPTIDSVELNLASTPITVSVYGAGFQSDAIVNLYDNDGSFWAQASYAYNNANLITFRLPSNTPPSNCNLSGSCKITAVIKNAFIYSTQGLKDYVSSEDFYVDMPRYYPPTILAAADNLRTCAWSQTSYVGSGGPNKFELFCTGISGSVLSKTEVGGGCYLGQAALGYELAWTGSTCNNFAINKLTILAPSSITASLASNSINVSWPASLSANSYQLYRNGVYRATVTGTSFNDTTVVGGVYYSYSVKACLGSNCSSLSSSSNGYWFPTGNVTTFNNPKKDGIILGVDLKSVSGTTYFSTDSVDYILDQTAFHFCSYSGFKGFSSYTTVSNYGAGHAFAARGNWWTYGGAAFKEINSVVCFK